MLLILLKACLVSVGAIAFGYGLRQLDRRRKPYQHPEVRKYADWTPEKGAEEDRIIEAQEAAYAARKKERLH